jgi:AraC-like DNA-binding protein
MGGMNNIETVSATIRHIEAHLTMTRLDLDTVASAVGYSKYYLHRIFHAAVGLSIHDYVQRRRLNEAARQLVFSDEPIIDIALLAGYGSQQAFTGAFASMYKQPPRQFRRRGVFYPLHNHPAPSDPLVLRSSPWLGKLLAGNDGAALRLLLEDDHHLARLELPMHRVNPLR